MKLSSSLAFFCYFFQFLNNSKFSTPIISNRQRKNMFDGQIHYFILLMIRDKGVFNLAKRRVVSKITPGCSPGVIWCQKQSDTWEGLQFVFVCL